MPNKPIHLRGFESKPDVFCPFTITGRKICWASCSITNKEGSAFVYLKLRMIEECKAGRVNGPISTPCPANIFCNSYHTPGIGFRNPSFSLAPNIRNGRSGHYESINQNNGYILARVCLQRWRNLGSSWPPKLSTPLHFSVPDLIGVQWRI